MNFINSILSEKIINALGWTIIHSLWQGALVALGFVSVMLFMRRSNARTRYMAGVIALMLILTMSVITFASFNQLGTSGIQSPGGKTPEITLTAAGEIQDSSILAIFFRNYFNRHLPLVVTLWGLGVLALVLHLAGGYLYNQRLKVHRIQSLPETWNNRLEDFCRQSGINTSIKLVESALVKVPMTIGHFKPVILFPLGMVTGLPQDQVEALLAHELAHILRRDYLVNLLQHLVDILFFYHPGVRWISTRVRAEREHCCDDIAVSLSGDSLKVARALTNIQDYTMGTPFPALAAAGKRTGAYGLLARVKRLLRPAVAVPGWSTGAICVSVLVVGLLTLAVSTNAAAAFSQDATATYGDSPAITSAQSADEENQQEKELQKKTQEKLLQLEMKMKAEQIELENKYKELLKKEEEAHRLGKELNTTEKDHLKKLETLLKDHELKLKQFVAQLHLQQVNMHKEQVDMREKEAEMQAKEAEMQEQEAEFQAQEAELEKQDEELKKQEMEMQKQEASMKAQEAEMQKQEIELQKQEEELKKQEAELQKKEKEEQKKYELFREVLVKELLQDKLISDSADFEFRIKAGKLSINGKEQSEAVFMKYKKLLETAWGKPLDADGDFTIVERK